MNRITNTIWTARLCVALFLLSVLFNFFPDFGALIDAEEWLANHSFDPVVVAFATGLVAIFLLSVDVWLALRIMVALFWIACQGHSVPEFLGLTDAAQWLIIHSADSMLTAFAAGLTLATLASPGLWREAWAMLPARNRAAQTLRQEPTAAAPPPEARATEDPDESGVADWAEAETASVLAAAEQPEPWDIEPDTTTDGADEGPIPVEPLQTSQIPTARPVEDASHILPQQDAETGLSGPDISPVRETSGDVTADVQTHPVPSAPMQPEPVVGVDDTPLPTPPAETGHDVPVSVAPTTVTRPVPEPWEIPPTVTVEPAAQHTVAETFAEAPLAAPEIATETVAQPVPPADSATETVVLPASAAVTGIQVTARTAPESHPVHEPWEIAPTVTVEAEPHLPVSETVQDVPPPQTEDTIPASVLLRDSQASAPEPVMLAKTAVRVEHIPTAAETLPERLPVAKTVSETAAVVAAPEVLSDIVPQPPAATQDEDSDILPDVAPEEDPAPDVNVEDADMGDVDVGDAGVGSVDDAPDDLPLADQAIELETIPQADAVAVEEDLAVNAVETDLPIPERDISAEETKAANDDPALPVTAFDVEPLPEPTLLPDMPPPAPARYDYWDAQPSFETWQAAWLWNAWEPQADDPVGPPSTARYLRLEDHLAKGMIRQVNEPSEGWMHAALPRQNLIDYAVACGERPKFLFPEERSWLASRLRVLQNRDVPLQELEGYLPYNEVKLALYKILRIINSEAVAKEVKASMRRGVCEGVARRISGGITYGYERIPRLTWRRLNIDWLGNVSGGGHRYSGLMVKFRDGYLDTPQTSTSAVAAYDAINSYLREEPDSKSRSNP